MGFPVQLGGSATISTVHYNSVVAALSSWPGNVSAGGNWLSGLGITMAGGSVAAAAALSIQSPALSSGAGVTVGAGVVIAAQSGAGIGTGYGIRQLGASDLNYFAGSVCVGVASTVMPWEVAGASRGLTALLSGPAPALWWTDRSGVNPNGGAGVTCSGLWALATINGDFTAYKGDYCCIAQSHQAGNSNAIRFGLPADDSGNYTIAVSMLRGGTVGIGTLATQLSGTGKLHVAGNTFRCADAARTPASSGDTCWAGEMFWDANYLYVAVGANTIKRVPLSSF